MIKNQNGIWAMGMNVKNEIKSILKKILIKLNTEKKIKNISSL